MIRIAIQSRLFLLSIILTSATFCFADDVKVTVTAPRIYADDSPGSVTTLDPAPLATQGVTTLGGALSEVPNLSYAGGTSRPRFFIVRGVGDLEQYVGSGLPAVNYAVDGIDLSGLGSIDSLFGIKEFTVRRGPVGIGTGQSASGGSIELTSIDPLEFLGGENSVQGQIEFTAASDNFLRAGALSAIPFSKSSALLLSAERSHTDGFLHNSYLSRDDTNHRDTVLGRSQWVWRPDSSSEIKLTGLHQHNDDGYDAFTIDNTRTTRSDRPGADDLTVNGGSLQARFGIDEFTRLRFDSQLSHASSTYSYDGDWGNNPFWGVNAPYDYFSLTNRDRHNGSVEAAIELGSTKQFHGSSLVTGVRTSRFTETSSERDDSSGDVYAALDAKVVDQRVAGFSEFNHGWSDRQRVFAGLRVEQQRVTFSSNDISDRHNELNWRVGFEQIASPAATWFFTVTRGYKGAGFNVGAQVPVDQVSFAPESVISTELGVKFTPPGHSSFGEFTLFREFRHRQQVRLDLQVDPTDPLGFIYLTSNSAQGDAIGAEAAATIYLTDRTRIENSVALLKATYDQVTGGSVPLSDRDLAHAPNWSGTTRLVTQLTHNLEGIIGVSATDQYFFADSNNAHSAAFVLANAALRYTTHGWSTSLWARNIFDRRYAIRGFFFGDEPPDFPAKRYIQRGDPAQVGLTVSYQW